MLAELHAHDAVAAERGALDEHPADRPVPAGVQRVDERREADHAARSARHGGDRPADRAEAP
ncbi:MAG: hypothetical protein ACLQAN_00505, partial [Acidimicrobiales bacterium]